MLKESPFKNAVKIMFMSIHEMHLYSGLLSYLPVPSIICPSADIFSQTSYISENEQYAQVFNPIV